MEQKPTPYSESWTRRPPDWDMRQIFRTKEFGDVIEDPALLETYRAWMNDTVSTKALAARIDVSSPNPFRYCITHHKNKIVGGRADWRRLPLMDFSDAWEMHFEQLAMEYSEAKTDGMLCHFIAQGIGHLERRYHRIIRLTGQELLVASALVSQTIQ